MSAITIPNPDFVILEGITTAREVTASAASSAPFLIGPGTGTLVLTGSSGTRSFAFTGFLQDVPTPGFATITIPDPDGLLAAPDIPPQLAAFNLVVPYVEAPPGTAVISAHPIVVFNGEAATAPFAYLTREESANSVFTALKNGPSEEEFQARIFPRVDGLAVLFARPAIFPATNPTYTTFTYTEVSEFLTVNLGAGNVAVWNLDDSTLTTGYYLPTDKLIIAIPTAEIVLGWRLLDDMGFAPTTGADGSTIPFVMESLLSVSKVRIYPVAAPSNILEFPAVRLTGANGNKMAVNFGAFYPEMGVINVRMPFSTTINDPQVFANLNFEAQNSRYAGTPVLVSKVVDPNFFIQLEDPAFSSVLVDLEWPTDDTVSQQVAITRDDMLGVTVYGTLSNPNPGGGTVDLTVGTTTFSLNVIYDPYYPETIQPMTLIMTNPLVTASPPPADTETVPVGDAVNSIDLCLFRNGVVAPQNNANKPAAQNGNPASPIGNQFIRNFIINNKGWLPNNWGPIGPWIIQMIGQFIHKGLRPFAQYIQSPQYFTPPVGPQPFDRTDSGAANGTPERWANFGFPSNYVGILMPDLAARKAVSRQYLRPKNIRGSHFDKDAPWLGGAFMYKVAPTDPEIPVASRSVSNERRWNTPVLISVTDQIGVSINTLPSAFTLQEMLAYKAEWMLSEFIAYTHVLGEEFLDIAGVDFNVGPAGPRSLGNFGPKYIQFYPYGGTPGDYISRLETITYTVVGRPDNIFILPFATGPLHFEISLDGGVTWVEYNPGTWSTTVAFPAIATGDTVSFKLKIKNMTGRHIFMDSVYILFDNRALAAMDYLTPEITGIPAGEPDPHPIVANQ